MGPAVKMFDYLSVGLPVVANDIGGWTRIIEDEEIGVLTESNPVSFAQGILKLIEDQRLSRGFGERGLELVRTKMNWDASAELLLGKIRSLLV
jgi:glycosyltransferase involved in cell wall biosynthesis